jgi:hypothetical protein
MEYVFFLNNIFPYRFFIKYSSMGSMASIVNEGGLFQGLFLIKEAKQFHQYRQDKRRAEVMRRVAEQSGA